MSLVTAARPLRILLAVGVLVLAAFTLPGSTEAATFNEVKKLLSPNGQVFDEFGRSVGVSGDTAIAGVYRADVTFPDAGAAYVFQRDDGGTDNWGEVATLTASDAQAFDSFGYSVAIDGDTAVVGAWMGGVLAGGGGAAYVFQRNEGGPDNWGEVAKLTASAAAIDKRFGVSVAVSGETVVVGALTEVGAGLLFNGPGAAYVFQRDEGGAGNWGEVRKLTASDAEANDNLGVSVAVNGDTVVVGALGEDAGGSEAGAAYVFQRNEGGADNWGEVKKLTSSDAQAAGDFGGSVAVSGDTAVVGASREDAGGAPGAAGAAYVFQRDQGGIDNWGEVRQLTSIDAQPAGNFGVSVTVIGDTAVVGAYLENVAGTTAAGAAYVFQRDEGGAENWGELRKLVASDAQHADFLGGSVAVSADIVVAGAWGKEGVGFNSGAVYIFDLLLPKSTPTITPTPTVPRPVGGVSLDSNLRPLALETEQPDGTPWGVVAGVLAAASLAALGGAAWHARRRANQAAGRPSPLDPLSPRERASS